MASLRRQRITADKRLRFTSPKLPSATSFIRKRYMKYAFPLRKNNNENTKSIDFK